MPRIALRLSRADVFERLNVQESPEKMVNFFKKAEVEPIEYTKKGFPLFALSAVAKVKKVLRAEGIIKRNPRRPGLKRQSKHRDEMQPTASLGQMVDAAKEAGESAG